MSRPDAKQITLYSCSDQIRSAIRTAFEGVNYTVTEITDGAKAARSDINEEQQSGAVQRLTLPEVVDGVVTKTALNRAVEGLAATHGLRQGRRDVYVYVLPQAIDALRDKLAKLGSLTLVGGDQAK